MAMKRMFDREVIKTDRFSDLSLKAKAAYFLMSMEADDEGFVSCKLVMRTHQIEQSDIDELIEQKFIIRFQSSIAVIVDWHKNIARS